MWKSAGRAAALALAVFLGCAHRYSPGGTCSDKEVALEVVYNFANRESQSKRLALRPDVRHAVDGGDSWKVRTTFEKGIGAYDAYIVVRKVDCRAEWAPVFYEK